MNEWNENEWKCFRFEEKSHRSTSLQKKMRNSFGGLNSVKARYKRFRKGLVAYINLSSLMLCYWLNARKHLLSMSKMKPYCLLFSLFEGQCGRKGMEGWGDRGYGKKIQCWTLLCRCVLWHIYYLIWFYESTVQWASKVGISLGGSIFYTEKQTSINQKLNERRQFAIVASTASFCNLFAIIIHFSSHLQDKIFYLQGAYRKQQL